MTRHSRNCTANSVYSYHERKQDQAASGFGSLAARYGKDGVKDFDCCCLSLHPCKNPVVTPEGILFEKEAILEYVLAKKAEIRKKIKQFEKQNKREQTELEELAAAEERTKFENISRIVPTPSGPSTSSGSRAEPALSNMKGGLAKKLPSFWIPTQTPDPKTTKLQKPDERVLCPMTDSPLRIKDLVAVRFTKLDPKASFSSLEGHKERYKCPVTGDTLRNSVGCAVLRPTGDVITLEAARLVRKDMKHPLNGQKLREKDIITMQRGGTGFAAANEQLAGVKARPVGTF